MRSRKNFLRSTLLNELLIAITTPSLCFLINSFTSMIILKIKSETKLGLYNTVLKAIANINFHLI